MWINLSTPIGAFASPYLQLHSRVDCIEPFHTRVVTSAPAENVFLDIFCHYAAEQHLKSS